ncbi:MAG TPA: hypothetical protein VLB76_21010 [Thermoanaerobaculia bacterium]|jgi:hypothetical protein|nr:hypothetical protein [Thermoanaerobaculia bacterium]
MRTKIATVYLVLIAFLCGGAMLAEAGNRNLAALARVAIQGGATGAVAASTPTPKAEAPDTSYIPWAIFQATPGSLSDWINLRGNNGLIRTASKPEC